MSEVVSTSDVSETAETRAEDELAAADGVSATEAESEHGSELESLREENEELRSRVHYLEHALHKAVSSSSVGSSDEAKLRALLKAAEEAKVEALQFHRLGKSQLLAEVRRLYGMLEAAKRERIKMMEEKDMLRRRVDSLIGADEGSKVEEVEVVGGGDVAATLQARVRALEAEVEAVTLEKQQLVSWARERQALFVSETDDLARELAEAKQQLLKQALQNNRLLAEELRVLGGEVKAAGGSGGDAAS